MVKRDTIIIADDAEINREILKMIFEEQYKVIEAVDGADAIRVIEKHHHEVAVLFLDLIMPGKSGLDVMKYMNLHGYMQKIPIIMITGEATAETDMKAYEFGAADIIYKPFEPKVVMRRALNLIELYESRNNMEEKLIERTQELVRSKKMLEDRNKTLVNVLSSAVEFRSTESGEHVKRVQLFTGIMLKYLTTLYPEYSLSDEDKEMIVSASALHDLGKIAIPDDILLKPDRLTEDEFEVMKKHTVYGCEMLESINDGSDFYRYCYDICRHHHEKYDGKGYPDGLKGEEIPIWAQVVSIVDVYDALVSKRVYKTPFAVDEAVRMIHAGECGEFSPKIMDCFNMAKSEFFAITEKSEYTEYN